MISKYLDLNYSSLSGDKAPIGFCKSLNVILYLL